MSELIDFVVGNTVIVTGTLTDEDDQPVPGATVTVRARLGANETSLGGATDHGGGIYSVTWKPPSSGTWHVRFEDPSQPGVAAEGIVNVARTGFST